MSIFLRLLVVSLVSLLLTVNASLACSIVDVPLRKVFRHADAVFRGKVVRIDRRELSPPENRRVPELWRDWKLFSVVTLDIENSWKGGLKGTKEFVAVDYYDCGCQDYRGLKVGDDLIVFADARTFITVCNSLKQGDKKTPEVLRRIDNFWFRAWATIYPF